MRLREKPCVNILVVLRVVLNSLDHITLVLPWKISNKFKVRSSQDPWLGYGYGHLFPQVLIDSLIDIGIARLAHINFSKQTSIWCHPSNTYRLIKNFVSIGGTILNPLLCLVLGSPKMMMN